MKKSTLKSKSSHPGIHRLFELLRKNMLSGAQFALLYDITDPAAAPNPFLQDMKPYIEQLSVSGWLEEDGKTLTEKGSSLFAEVEKLFKVNKNVAPDVPAEIAEQFNQLFPQLKIPTSGKYARCSEREVQSSFTWFFKQNKDKYSWDTIMRAGTMYVNEYEQKNWEYMKRSKYFIRRQLRDGSVESELEEYCERIINNIHEDAGFDFTEKVV